MDIKKELLAHILAEHLCSQLFVPDIDWEKEMNTIAIRALSEIREALHKYDPMHPNDHEDWLTLEKVMAVFEKYGISTGSCRDFK